MSEGKFEKLTQSDKALYGPRKLILCGFAAGTQVHFSKVLAYAGLPELPLIWAAEALADDEIGQIMALPADTGADTDSALPRAIIVGGITENELHNLMNTCRASGMQSALWAVLTPASEKWTLRQLITELAAERTALSKKKPV